MILLFLLSFYFFNLIYSSCPPNKQPPPPPSPQPVPVVYRPNSNPSPPIVYLPQAPFPYTENGGYGAYPIHSFQPHPVAPCGSPYPKRSRRSSSSRPSSDDYDLDLQSIEQEKRRLKARQKRLENQSAQVQAERESIEKQRELERQQLAAQRTQLENQRSRQSGDIQDMRNRAEREIYNMRRRADDEIRARMTRDDQSARHAANDYYRKIREWESKIFELETRYRRILNDISMMESKADNVERRVRNLQAEENRLKNIVNSAEDAARESGQSDKLPPPLYDNPSSTSEPSSPPSGSKGFPPGMDSNNPGSSSLIPSPQSDSSTNFNSGGPTNPADSFSSPTGEGLGSFGGGGGSGNGFGDMNSGGGSGNNFGNTNSFDPSQFM